MKTINFNDLILIDFRNYNRFYSNENLYFNRILNYYSFPKPSIKKELDEYENDYSLLSRSEQNKFDLINNPLGFYKFYSLKYPTVSRLARN